MEELTSAPTNATTDTQPQLTKAKVLTVLNDGQTYLQAFMESLTEDERAEIGGATQWSAKDNLAHIAYWALRVHEVFDIIRVGGELPSPEEEFQPVNERIFAEWRERPWGEVATEARRAYAQLTVDVEDFSEEVLSDPHRFPSRNGEPLAVSVINTATAHPSEHYGQFYAEHGRPDLATAMQERNVSTIRDIFGDSEVYGDALYNLGCFYAKKGQAGAAIDAVRQSFQLHNWLIEWSKQDSDLDSLRELPAFQALYA